MIFFKKLTLAVMLLSTNVLAANFSVDLGSEKRDVGYYELHGSDGKNNVVIDGALEGNSNQASIRETRRFDCSWGTIESVRVSMSSPSENGPMVRHDIYFFDNNLKIVAAKSITKFDLQWSQPQSIENDVCERKIKSVEYDGISGSHYIVDQETIVQGPFKLKGNNDSAIKFIRNDALKLVIENNNSQRIVDTYNSVNDFSAHVATVFFMTINGVPNIVSLIYWPQSSNNTTYKVYAYAYNHLDKITLNKKIDSDVSLDTNKSPETQYRYKNAEALRNYLREKYN